MSTDISPTKPEKPGMATDARKLASKIKERNGTFLAKPPMETIFLVPVDFSTLPTVENMSDMIKPWDIIWKTAP
jgi:hypothetical protein